MDDKSPRLRTVEKIKPPYLLNQFLPDFGINLGKEIVYTLATKSTPDIAGAEWEQIFATCINATWQPSNVGLDDIVLRNCAWSAKSIKAARPDTQKTVRLIAGRNSPTYSYDQKNFDVDPQIIGNQVLNIWNGRVDSLRAKFSHLRTVVLMKSGDLTELAVFEFETVLYPPDQFVWQQNVKGNLEGLDRVTKFHRFTWQPHGSQFTIIEVVPDDCLLVKIRKLPQLNKADVLTSLQYDDSWITVSRRNQ
ncbi:MAG: hypothetical protein RBS68_08965 [Anaerolineales bacterium]|jgi:hypothetical protein|nr:hypothetical protein [Anaerolineales bacterium]